MRTAPIDQDARAGRHTSARVRIHTYERVPKPCLVARKLRVFDIFYRP
jgi:hypothetical protein